MPDSVTLRDIEGKAHQVPAELVGAYKDRGFTEETRAEHGKRVAEDVREDLYGGIGGKIASFGTGALRTATLGLSDVVGEALGHRQALKGLRDENPIAALGGELLGAFAPVGPAAGLTGLGRKIVSTGTGAGVVAKAGITAGAAAVEGAGFGGGMYLSQVALDDKPLAAEGFIGAMGHGALFAAPIGGVFSLGESTLIRARQLFPQQQVTHEAARGVKQEATTALTQSVADGDQMAQAIQRKIELSEAKIGMAESGERVTRRMFGEADPAALGDQVAGALDKTQLAGALQKYQVSRAQLDDWIRHEADPELEAALLGLRTPEVGQIGGRIEKRAGKMFEPELAQGTPVSPEFRALNEALDMRARQIDVTKVGKRPANDVVPEELIAGVGKPSGTAEPASLIPEYSAVRAVDGYLEQTIPARQIAERGYFEPPGGGTDPVRIEKARKIFESGGPGQQEAVTLGVTPSGKVVVDNGRHRLAAAIESNSPIKVKWFSSHEPSREMVQRGDAVDAFRHREAMSANEFEEYASSFARQLSDAEKEAAVRYSRASHQSINGALRRGATDGLGSKFKDDIRDLDSIMSRSATPRDMVVMRGIKDPDVAAKFKSMNSGDEFVDGGYVSTSLAGRPTDEFRGVDVEFRISVPKGSRAAPITTEAKAGERELLLDRGQRFKIESSVYDPFDKKTIIHASLVSGAGAAAPADDLLSALRGTESKLNSGSDLGALSRESPAAADYASKKLAKRADDAAYFRAKYAKPSGLEGIADAQRMVAGEGAADDFFSQLTKPKTRDAYVAQNIGRAMREEGGHAPALARLEREWAAQGSPKIGKAIVEHAGADETTIGKVLGRRTGKNVDMSPDLSRAAKVIGDVEESIADMADVLGAEAPITAAEHAKLFRAARAAQADAAATGVAQAGQDLATKVQPMLNIGDTRTMFGGKTVVDDEITKALRAHDAKASSKLPPAEKPVVDAVPPSATPAAAGSVLGKLADVGTALEVLQAMGVHVPDISKIPVIGPVLSIYLKARAVLSILGRKGGSIPRSTEGLVASKSAETRNRINAATTALLEGGAKASKKIASYAAGPAVLLGTQLFPGEGETKSKDARKLYEARIDELTRAQQPGAVAAAIGDRIQTSDPVLREAVVAQVERGLKFLYGKAPKQTLIPGMIPGDGDWHPSKTVLEEFGRFVHAVNDPASVLEDLAKGHISIEGAEALRVVYPALFAEAQKLLLEAAPKMNKTMPYSRRVAISIMYQIPIDGSMTPQHMQFLQPPPTAGAAPMPGVPPGPPPAAPALTGPLQTGQQMAPPLDRRAGA